MPRWALVVVPLAALGCARPAPAVPCPTVPAAPAAPAPSASPARPASEALAALARFEGAWRGEGHGEPGDSSVERTYRWVLGGKFLEVRSKTTYRPQPRNPKGEVHEDVGYLGHDGGRKRIVMRQFHVEGFVNQYLLDPASAAGTFVFTSEAIENIPAGYRARETLRFTGDDELEETFEIAAPGKDFAVYSTTKLERVAATPP